MPSLIYFGRAGLPTASGGDGMSLYRGEFECEGDEATVDLIVRGQSSANDAKALRDQLLGYHLNTDEPVIPIVDNADSSRTGFYRVQRVKQVPELTGREGSSSAGIAYRLTAELLRVPGWQAPLFEVVCSGANRSTAHVITEWSWVGTPSQIDGPAGYFTSGGVHDFKQASGADGIYFLRFADPGSKTGLYDNTFLFSAAASSFHENGCRIQSSVDAGTTWRTVVGRQLGVGSSLTADELRLSNGIVEVTPFSTSDFIKVVTYSGGGVPHTKTYKLSIDGSTATALDLNLAPTILRNDVMACSVRVWFEDIANDYIGYCDFTVRRGSWVVECHAVLPNGNTAAWGVFRSSNEAGTGVTGGIDATAADADGNKYQLRSPTSVTAETTKGGVYLGSAAQAFPFAIATDANAGDNTTAPSTSGLYFAAMNHRLKIAAR